MLESIFVIWTTFVCANGEIASVERKKAGEQRFFSRNLYSSELYTDQTIGSGKDRWRKTYTTSKLDSPKACIGFMIQAEDVTDELILKQFMGMRY